MKTIRALFALLMVFSLMGIAAPALAARASSDDVFTIRTTDSRIPVEKVAADWSKNTDVTVNVGQCSSGPYCILITVADIPCDDSRVSGCARTVSDGSCVATVGDHWANDPTTSEYVSKHEVGHCIWYVGGFGGHLDDPRALMYYGFYPGVNKAVLTSIDRSTTRSLF